MEQSINGVVEFFIGQGPLGVLCLFQAVGLYFLWKDNRGLRTDNTGLQEKRVTESKESMMAINASSRALETHGTVLQDLLREIREARITERRRA